MGKWIHRLSGVDPVSLTAMCSNCGVVKIRRRFTGKETFRCINKAREDQKSYMLKYNQTPRGKEVARANNGKWRKNRYRKHCKMVCEKCGFQATSIQQMDIHHKDRNRTNNSIENLESLCSNCHRMEHINDPKLVKARTGVAPVNKPGSVLVSRSRRITTMESTIKELESLLNRAQSDVKELKKANLKLLEDIDRLSKSVDDWKERYEDCVATNGRPSITPVPWVDLKKLYNDPCKGEFDQEG
jgi:5-methylcytosine-specific restriction endonuclease McrA